MSSTPSNNSSLLATSYSSSSSYSSEDEAPSKQRSSHCDQPCWICFGSDGDTRMACKCPRQVHPRCLARWQLQQAGKSEEKFCRFCFAELPDWKSTLTPSSPLPDDPIMVVTLGDEVHRISVKPGAAGMAEFKTKIRRLFNISEDIDFDVTFRCKAPLEDGEIPSDTIQLDGMGSYEAAAHCASLMAAQRVATGGPHAFRGDEGWPQELPR
ncbi:hypothetical protein CEUSTIGMA_g3267.t1 [Chlamydomonas eustigma]|uniref:RING-CH-type domain-containing protein n=1 Tax=Chlamydomonas eustigma TaxID=1157962 RepID=A0A250WYA3_9CHLO|nr:hypothetical protein CEUSTIGMA_g3267.t1 [Chlamydomonas eustigma]|eukprot:GAX75824.1 hypothetical protein CEUSTIGMA_g3267.t1 [Chlamydomonas eustigma]